MKLDGTCFLMMISGISTDPKTPFIELDTAAVGNSNSALCLTISTEACNLVIYNGKAYRGLTEEVYQAFSFEEIVHIEIFGGELIPAGYDGEFLCNMTPPLQGNGFDIKASVVVINKLTDADRDCLKKAVDERAY